MGFAQFLTFRLLVRQEPRREIDEQEIMTIEHSAGEGVHVSHCPACHVAIPYHLGGCPVEQRMMLDREAREWQELVETL